jgi:hypothetical protein
MLGQTMRARITANLATPFVVAVAVAAIVYGLLLGFGA